MPEREEIISNLNSLPEIQMGHVAGDHEIWEGNEMGAHFKVTKEVYPEPLPKPLSGRLTLYALSVSGLMIGKEGVISDFIHTLGTPLARTDDLASPGPTFAMWHTG